MTKERDGRNRPMQDEISRRVSDFYETVGWENFDGSTEDARRWEDLRECARDYVRNCRLRVLRHIPPAGDYLLDMASGPIQFREYLEYSRNFKKRYCVDLSHKALEVAKQKIGEHGVFLQGDFLNIPLEKNFFDCTVSLHTIYHIDKDKQEEAVRKLLYVTKPDKSVIIIYSNPKTLMYYVLSPLKILRNIKNLFLKKKREAQDAELYFYAHPLGWWKRFQDVAEITILPWRSFPSQHQKLLIRGERIGKVIFRILFEMEDRFPKFFVKYFQYPMIILRKRKTF